MKIDMEWTKITKGGVRPLLTTDYDSFTRSEDILITDGKKIWVGYFQVWDDEISMEEWKMSGPDGYEIVRPTHWARLPDLPK